MSQTSGKFWQAMRLWFSGLLVLTLWAVAGARPGLPVVADGEHLWWVRSQAEQGIAILHRHVTDEPSTLAQAVALTGQVQSAAVAAGDGRLWLVYEGGLAQTIEPVRSEIDRQWRYTTEVVAPLPEAAHVRAMAAGDDTAWVLLRVESEASLEQVDHPRPAADEGLNEPTGHDPETVKRIYMGLGLEPAQTQPTTQPGDGGETEGEPGTRSQAIAVDRLLRLEAGQWRKVDLPADWSQGSPAWLVAAGPERGGLWLVVEPDHRDRELVWVYEWRDGTWRKQTYRSRIAQERQVLVLQGQLLLIERQPGSEGITTAVSVLRDQQVQPIGQMTIDQAKIQAWSAVPMGLTVALVAQLSLEDVKDADLGRQLGLWWTRMDLQGQAVQPSTPLLEREPAHWAGMADTVLMVTVLVLAMLLMFVFWRRDVAANRLVLPEGLVLASLPRRMVAGAIDLGPGVGAVMFWYGLTGDELLARWPGLQHGASLEALEPGLVAIGIFLIHVTLTELIAARSLGKMLTGLRVTTLTGQRPSAGQLLVRNLLKSFDLVAPLLLVLPVIGPYAQRLGDLVARTVVVMPAPTGEQGPKQKQQNNGQDEDGD